MIRVLLADDNAALCETLRQALDSQPDMSVAGVAYDGEEALSKIEELTPDVVVLDITMPHLDGMAVLERLFAADLGRPPCIIVLTALASEEIMQRFVELGARYFMVKPFDVAVLVERIRQFQAEASDSVAEKTRESYRHLPAIEEESYITRLLHEMGVPPHFRGYNYLREAVLMVLRDDQILGGALTTRLYPRLAAKYDTTPGGIEAAIRNSMTASWNSGNRAFIAKLTGSAGTMRKTCPTNSVTIAKLAAEVRLRRELDLASR